MLTNAISTSDRTAAPAPVQDHGAFNPLPKLLSGEDLIADHAQYLFERLVLGKLEPGEIGGMLIALRMKGETAEEMIGAAHALSAAATPFDRPDYLFADCCGTGGDGSGLINVSTATGFAAGAVTAASSEGSSATRSQTSKAVAAGRYIVTFADEPAASYEGGVSGYPRTRPDAGKKLDPTRPEVVRYRDRLTKQHDAALTRVGATKLYDYTVATNGVLSDLTAGQARTLSSTAGVRLEKDAIRTLDTTETPGFVLMISKAGRMV